MEGLTLRGWRKVADNRFDVGAESHVEQGISLVLNERLILLKGTGASETSLASSASPLLLQRPNQKTARAVEGDTDHAAVLAV